MLAIATLAGCSTTPSSTNGPVTLRVQFELGGTDAAIYKTYAKGFEATHKNVTVKLEGVTTAAKTGTNLTVLSSPNAPDVGLLPTNTPAYTSLVSKGGLVDLATVWKNQDLDKRYPTSIDALTEYKNKHYVLAFSTVYYSFLYYNEDLFKKDGITVPADHRIASASQLYSIVDALKAGGSQPLAMAGKSGFQASWMVDALLPTSANKSELANYLDSSSPSVPVTAKFSSPAFVDTLKTLNDYNEHGVFQTGFLGMVPGDTESMFIAGKAGMLLDGSWESPVIRQAKVPFKFGFLLLPPVHTNETAQLDGFYGAEVVIPKTAKHIALAEQFLEYMVSDQGQAKAVAQAGSLIPAVNTVPTSAFKTLDPLVQEMQADVNKHGSQSGFTSVVPPAVGQTTLDPLIQSMYAGGTTPQAIGAKIQASLVALRAQAK